MLNPITYIKEYILLQSCSNYNSDATRKAARTKKRARATFAQEGVPHAAGAVFLNPLSALRFVQQYGFPVVVKPNYGGFSRGSFFPITSYAQLFRALVLVKCYWPTTVIEQYLSGKNYRVVIGRGKILAVTRRYPPFVIGDGKRTVAELIAQENAVREQMGLYPTMSPIDPKRSLVPLTTLPKKGARVSLGRKIALEPGGCIENLPGTMPAKNRKLFEQLLRAFNANILGIDVIMSKGIEYAYDTQACIFLEANARPYVKMHRYPRYGKPVDIDRKMQEKKKKRIIARS
ncbi:MAG: cyanophycin synthetase [Candidatus Woesearchaeota archaeon]|nr:cyanophycin synthetase [Candidatus Woesearchaeota archaeon]